MRHDVKHATSEAETLFVRAEQAEERGLLEDAASLWLRAANLEHSGAQVNLGNAFSWGKGVPQSNLKAAYWYKRAYRNGDESGALNFAVDKLKEGNTRAAICWLKKAIELGSGEAAVALAKVYLDRPNGKSKAIELLRLTRRMKRAEISEQAQEDAAALLSSIEGAQQAPQRKN